ncbi:hypothetical protein ACH4ZX_38090 [Streptomyces sp. NPDC020490]|uniref:hypothetical protein n=1 Tax=Streptomyces sp. NPDC020490 TaxID=3365078 RepID=UPI00378FC82B
MNVRKAVESTVVALAITLSASLLAAAPASASVCTTPGCGGEVSNNSSTNYSIRIANCWRDEYGTWENGDKLSCVSHPNNWGYYYGDAELPRGDESIKHYYYYDTDAIRFYRGCTTRYHFWGGNILTEDRHGKDSLWRKISRYDHVYINSIVC